MKIAAFCPNWIGDAVMATPALLALRRRWPAAKLIGVLRPYVADVYAGGSFFNKTVPLKKGALRGLAQTTLALRAEKIDVAVLFTNSFRTALAAYLSGCKQIIGEARDGRSKLLTRRVEPEKDEWGRFKVSPVIDAYNRLAMAAGAEEPGHAMRLFTTDHDEAQCDQVWRKLELDSAESVTLLNPGAAFGSSKLWPAEHFSKLAQRLADEQRQHVLVLCGPAERDLARRIAAEAKRPNVKSLAGEAVSLGLLKACVRRADLLVTTDSGPRHFAAAFSKPVVTLFGPTHIAWTETYHPLAWHLQKPVPCGPCQERVCPEKHHRCMTDLGVDEVFAAAVRFLDQNDSNPDSRTKRRALPLLLDWWSGWREQRKGA